MIKTLSIAITIIVLACTLFSQDKSPCSLPEAKQFDFWVGEWDLSWKNEKGVTETGTNKVTKILDGCVVQENFSTSDGSFKGTSVSLYNAKLERWQQTWVDNSGAYFDFTGFFNSGMMILSHNAKDKDGNPITYSMVFYNITENEFDWRWESSTDNGFKWTELWKIHYKRKV
jgi:hypothetical protein